MHNIVHNAAEELGEATSKWGELPVQGAKSRFALDSSRVHQEPSQNDHVRVVLGSKMGDFGLCDTFLSGSRGFPFAKLKISRYTTPNPKVFRRVSLFRREMPNPKVFRRVSLFRRRPGRSIWDPLNTFRSTCPVLKRLFSLAARFGHVFVIFLTRFLRFLSGFWKTAQKPPTRFARFARRTQSTLKRLFARCF